MKKILSIMCLALFAFMTVACGSADTPAKGDKAVAGNRVVDEQSSNAQGKRILVVYFSRAGENYNVGYINKGNTHIMADIIAEATHADLFEIKTVNSYPENYKECTEVARQELDKNTRPALATKVDKWQDYDTVFIGYPIWWSYPPMAIYTFIESYDWRGKTVIPFCTSAGDVLTGKESDFPKYGKGMILKDGLGLEGKRVQENPDSAKADVMKWLGNLGYIKN